MPSVIKSPHKSVKNLENSMAFFKSETVYSQVFRCQNNTYLSNIFIFIKKAFLRRKPFQEFSVFEASHPQYFGISSSILVYSKFRYFKQSTMNRFYFRLYIYGLYFRSFSRTGIQILEMHYRLDSRRRCRYSLLSFCQYFPIHM